MLSLLAKALSGAYVGYITNDLAIQMLFRKRFGLGGIVLRTREEFIANISKLVERDIINHHTVERELSAAPEAFGSALANLVNDLVSDQLLKSLPSDFTLDQVPGLDQTVGQLLARWQPAIASLATEVLAYASREVQVQAILSPRQLRQLAGSLGQALGRAAAGADTLPGAVTAFYTAHGHQPLGEWLPTGLLAALRARLKQEALHAHVTLQDHLAAETDQLIGQAAATIGLDQVVANLAQDLSDKKLVEIFGSGHATQLSEEMALRLRQIVGSPEGRQLVAAFGDFVLEVLANEKTTVFELMSDNVAEQFAHFLRAQLPGILKNLMEWLEERQHQLEVIIDSTFRKNITSRFQDFIFRLFVGSVSQYASIVDRITDLLDKHRQNPDETAETLTEEVIGFLQGNTIGQIVGGLRANSALVRDLDLGGVLATNIEQALTAKQLGFINTAGFFEHTLGELIGKAEIHQFLEKAVQTLLEKELKTNFIFSGKLGHLLAEILEKQWQKIESQPLEQLFSLDKAQRLVAGMAAPDRWSPDWLGEVLVRATAGKTVGQVADGLGLGEWPAHAGGPVAEQACARLHEAAQQAGQRPVATYLPWLAEAARGLPPYLQKLLVGNLPALLQGRIEEVVKGSLSKMSPEKLLDLVEKFMGRELKPITLLGALLGGMAGVALAVLPASGNSWTDTAVAAVAYGITGFATNWLALKMIFRPYKKWQLLGMRVPLTPGVVARNQGRFAENMGKFVAGGLLSPENLKNAFAQRRELFRERLTALLVADQDQLLGSTLAKHQATISHYLADQALAKLAPLPVANLADGPISPDYLGQLLARLGHFLAGQAGQPLSRLDLTAAEAQVRAFMQGEAWRQSAASVLANLLVNAKTSTKPIDVSLAAWQPALATWLGDQIGQWASTSGLALAGVHPPAAGQPGKAPHAIWDMLRPRLEALFARATASSLHQFINSEQQQKVKAKLGQLLRQRLIDRELRLLIYNFIDNRLAEELAPHKKINELFGGNVTRLLRQNMDTIVENLIQFGLDWLEENKEMLAEKVYEKAYEQNRVGTFLYKSAVKGTVIELAEEGIPEFFRRESKSLKWLVADSVEQLGESPLSALNIGVDEDYLKALVDTFLGREEMHEAVERLLYLLLDELFKLPLSVFLGMAGVQSADDLFRIFRPEAEQLGQDLGQRLGQHSAALGQLGSGWALGFLAHRLARTSPADLLAEVPGPVLDELARQLVGSLVASPHYLGLKDGLVAAFVAEARQLTFGQLVDAGTLQADLDRLARQFLGQPAHRAFLAQQLAQLVEAALPALPGDLAPEARQFLADRLVGATLAALENHLDPLIASVNLRKIVVGEVSEMNPKEIEDLFYSFADRYFTELINYGFGFGVVFGLVVDLGLVYGVGWVLTKVGQ